MSTALNLMTVEELLPWADGKEGRWELHDDFPVMISAAEPVMMSPEWAAHIRTKLRLWTAPSRLPAYRAKSSLVA